MSASPSGSLLCAALKTRVVFTLNSDCSVVITAIGFVLVLSGLVTVLESEPPEPHATSVNRVVIRIKSFHFIVLISF